ncbi:hypothetical protein KIPB_014694, partial [Kipferlia bialata]|eukprot:g14694.t1
MPVSHRIEESELRVDMESGRTTGAGDVVIYLV